MTDERPPDEQRYRLLFEQSPSPQLLLDEDLRFVEVNEAACVLLGRSATELIGTPWVSVVHPDERTESLAAGREAVRRRHEIPFYRADRRLILPDDRTIKVVAMGVHVTDDSKTREATRGSSSPSKTSRPCARRRPSSRTPPCMTR